MIFKRIIAAAVGLTFCFTTAFAAPIEDIQKGSGKDTNKIKKIQYHTKKNGYSSNIQTLGNKKFLVTTITDKDELAKEESVKGKKPLKVEILEEVVKEDAPRALAVASMNDEVGWPYVKSGTTQNLGSGWYYESSPQWDSWWEGPDIAKISQTIKATATASYKASIKSGDVTNEVGFTIGGEYAVVFESNTTVPADQTLNVKSYVSYTKYSFDIWEAHLVGMYHWLGTGYAYKPTGALFKKYFYNK